MKFEIIINNKPKLEKIAFNCDAPIDKKLDIYPMVRDALNKYCTTVIVGRQGSGKTSLTINLILKLYRKNFHKVYLFMPATSQKSLKKNIFDTVPDEQKFEELNVNTIKYVYDEITENRKTGLKSLIIMDDVQKALKDINVIREFKNIVANQRHLKVVNLILLQNFFALDNKIREIINNIIFFKMDKVQNNKIFDEVAEMPKDTFNELNDIIFDEPHNWCLINQRIKKIYKMFDEIKYTDE
jgi:GTPase SAR1 family protein